ncbi:hypothetical protein C8Q69DRAFT_410268, partial [Paecilomyces variotii]
IIIRDINLPPLANKFSKEFSRILVSILIDLFSKYNQLKLAEELYNLIAFYIPRINLINIVLEFIYKIIKVLINNIPNIYNIFLDNTLIQGPKTNYREEKVLPKIRRFIFKYI